jgi:T-complex protein 1 subunit theta
MVILI